ncbi:MAG: T9SS type A sorting domain-containing protein [Melioribacteraceae bacterium]|nr:MAG: T9SS type A sorting domain-containing protein [Melioribacteraceae bacterium]
MKNMKRLCITFLFVLIFATSISAQWQKISELNIGVTGQITAYGSYVYFYGSQSGFKLYRYDESGENFTDLSSNTPSEFSHIFGFDGKLYACYLSNFYTSTDNGETWNVLSTVSVTGNGAVLRITNDGDILYGISNRKSIFKSIDKGNTWQEIIINDPNNLSLVSLAVVGDKYVGVILNSGAWISKDAGQTWTVNNVSPSIAITAVYNFNGKIIGQSFNGIYVYDFDANTWVAGSAGLPSDGTFYITRSISQFGGTLYLGGSTLIGSQSSVFTSTDGSSWNAVNLEGIPTTNGAGSVNFVAANSQNIFCFYYGVFDPANTGFYKIEYSNTTAVNIINGLPAEYNLSQNYPNPFNPSTKINFSIPENEFVSLKIFNAVGEQVQELVNQNLSAGSYTVDFNAGDLSSGIYFYSLTGNNFSSIKKMILIK